MKRFDFCSEDLLQIKHSLCPEKIIQVVVNPDPDELISWDGLFEKFSFNGYSFVFKWEDPFHPEEYNLYKNVLKRAWKWYRSQVFIPAPSSPVCQTKLNLNVTREL